MSDRAEGRPTARARTAIARAQAALGDPRARPDLGWLAFLSDAPATTLAPYLAELGAAAPVEREIRRRHREAGRPNYAQFRAPFELYVLVRHLRPDHVIETGVSSGVSSAHLLLALRKNGRGTLHSIDLPTRQRGPTHGARETPVALPPGRESGWAVPEELRAGWDLRLGPSERRLPELVAGLPSIGLFLHDSRHTPTHLAFELATVRPKLTPGSVVLADNTVWTGQAFPRFARSLGVRPRARGRSDLVGLRVPAPTPPPATEGGRGRAPSGL